jgi:hypothetical protein
LASFFLGCYGSNQIGAYLWQCQLVSLSTLQEVFTKAVLMYKIQFLVRDAVPNDFNQLHFYHPEIASIGVSDYHHFVYQGNKMMRSDHEIPSS